MTEEDYQYNLREMKLALEEQAAKYPLLPGLVYTSPFDFIAQHGVGYKPIPWRWGKDGVGVQKQCFGNAIANAGKYQMKYVEGFALAPTGEIILHGWNDYEGELMDPTWANTGLCYIGVEFSLERADDATWNGDAHIINDENRNYPIFQKRWEGEDYSIQWPDNDRLAAYRRWRKTGKYVTPPSVVAWLLNKQGREA